MKWQHAVAVPFIFAAAWLSYHLGPWINKFLLWIGV